MAGPKTSRWLLANKYFPNYQKEIVRVLSSVPGSEILGTVLAPARATFAPHPGRVDNPHAETPASLGIYSNAEILTQLNTKLGNGILPLSSYGVVDGFTDAEVNAAWTYTGLTVQCSALVAAVMSGGVYSLLTYSLILSDLGVGVANKTFYMYVKLTLGKAAYFCSDQILPESKTCMYIGKITTNATQITSTSFSVVSCVDGYRLSTLPVGKAIPISGGTYDATAP